MDIKTATIEELEIRLSEIRKMMEDEAAEINADELTKEVDEIEARKLELSEQAEKRAKLAEKIAEGEIGSEPTPVVKEDRKMTKFEERANQFVVEKRTVLTSGVLTGVATDSEIGKLPEVISSIVDDVDAFTVNGIGSYNFAYKSADAVAAAVTDGSAVASASNATFATGSITPSTWGTLDTVSKLVAKESPANYLAAVQNSAYLALRAEAKSNIAATILADASASTRMTETKTYTLDKDFVRNLVLGFDADESVEGAAKLYLCKQDLATLGAVRGTNEKKAVFDIKFKDANNGQIIDGGMAVDFSILSDLNGAGASGGNAMIYGQPKAIKMPMWGAYEVATDEGGKYFEANLIAIRGLQTAGVGITRLKAIQLINA